MNANDKLARLRQMLKDEAEKPARIAKERREKWHLGLEYEDRMESYKSNDFSGASDERIDLLVESGEAYDDEVVTVKLLLSHGLFDAGADRISDDHRLLGLSARGINEINILIKSLRWIADQLSEDHPPFEYDNGSAGVYAR